VRARRTGKSDRDEKPVLEGTLEDIELAIKSPGIDRVENLGENNGVERRVVTTSLLCSE